MLALDINKIYAIAEKDSEFVREMRFFDGSVGVSMGDIDFEFDFVNGTLTGMTQEGKSKECVIELRGPESTWEEMLKPVPKPYYQCLQTTWIMHDLMVSSDKIEMYAYLSAMNRLLRIMKIVKNGGESR